MKIYKINIYSYLSQEVTNKANLNTTFVRLKYDSIVFVYKICDEGFEKAKFDNVRGPSYIEYKNEKRNVIEEKSWLIKGLSICGVSNVDYKRSK